MLQEINLLGIRKQTILCHFEKICDLAVMKEITETDEKNIDKGLRFNTGTQFIERDKIILYGEINKEIAVSIFSVLSYFLIKTIVEKWK